MKKIVLGALALFILTPNVFAAESAKDYGKLCAELGGQHMILESFPVQEKCRIGEQTISMDSFQDKYRHYIDGLMIHYSSEFKYSSEKKWKNYLEFYAQDNADLEAFSTLKLDQKVKDKIADDLKVQIGLYNFMAVQDALGEKVTSKIEKILSHYEAKIPEVKLQTFYKKFALKLDAKVKEMEYFQMVAHFTPEGYKAFLFKMNVYKYMLYLVNGRME